jgi:hypothetical protein
MFLIERRTTLALTPQHAPSPVCFRLFLMASKHASHLRADEKKTQHEAGFFVVRKAIVA